jgi:V/A-type H+-transporting ATPase subunit I
VAISRLNLVTINFNKNQYNEVLLKILAHDDFHPEPASKFTDRVAGLSNYNQENSYEDIVQHLEEASNKYGFDISEVEVENNPLNTIKCKEYLDEFFTQIGEIDKVYQDLQVIIKENKEAIIQLQHVIDSHINFDDLFSSKYLQIRFGKLPLEYVDKLEYYKTLPFTFISFEQDKQYTWCMYITTPANAPEIDNIFSSLYFERIYIPKFVHGEPDLAMAEIQEESDAAALQADTLRQRIIDRYYEHKDEINRIYSVAKHLNEVFVLQPFVVEMGEKLVIYGFVPKRDTKAFKTSLEEVKNIRVDVKPCNSDVRLEPPTKLRNGWFARPFRMFVEMYGLPSYNDVDPTLFVALTYTLLFGMMFGDIGQGLLLSLVGFIAYKYKGFKLGEIGLRIGISSAAFGIIFGSIFGNEHILMPFFNPMDAENTMTLLMISVGLGVVFILIAMLFNIFLNVRKKNYGELFFSQNGICGFIFYVALLGMVLNMMLGMSFINIWYVLFLLVIPIIGVFLKEPLSEKLKGKKMFPHGFGAFFVEGFFELFEVVLTFVTNTVSFLRVGGFVLSHAGMMLVVYTIAGMVGGIGYWIVLVLGNIFVMCLEGMIVGIQVLRLEFYEMFSRYYDGKGKPFHNIKEQ